MNFNEELNSINDFVSYVKACKEAMRQALISQEQVVSEEATLDTYAGYITAIEGGGGVTVYTVQYLDWDGAVLKSKQVLPGGDVLPPTNPSRESYNFTGWSGMSLNVQLDLTITAQYEYAPNTVVFLDYKGAIISTQNIVTGEDAVPPIVDWGNVILDSWSDYTNIQGRRVIIPTYHSLDGKTYLDIELDETTGLSPTLRFGIESGINRWAYGDGATGANNVPTFTEPLAIQHTYPLYGKYTISLWCDSGADGHLFKQVFVGDYISAIKSFTEGTHEAGEKAFLGHTGLTSVCFTGANYTSSFEGCTGIESILIPAATNSSLYSAAFKDCINLKTVVINKASVMTLYNVTAFENCHPDLKIYVPDNLVDSYKAASGWSVLADKIHPLTDYANAN